MKNNEDYKIKYAEDGYSFCINKTKIKEKIFNNELSDWSIKERAEFINILIDWIGEAKGSDKELMKADLKYLINAQDEFIFSSILTNEYVLKSDNEAQFNEICKELLKLNDEVE